jgi:hypothetical protein
MKNLLNNCFIYLLLAMINTTVITLVIVIAMALALATTSIISVILFVYDKIEILIYMNAIVAFILSLMAVPIWLSVLWTSEKYKSVKSKLR